MPLVRVTEGESIESAIKKFKRQCAEAGILSEWRSREYYMKPSVKKKVKAEVARKKRMKQSRSVSR